MKTLIFDLDGTMYRGTQIIETAKQFLDVCIQKNIPFIFLTNNSMRTQEENVAHMEQMGYQNIKPSLFYNSAMASVQYVLDMDGPSTAFYIGKAGMRQALLDGGFTITQDHPKYVFVGLNKDLSYKEYSQALTYVLDGATLIGTNKDRILAKPGGFEMGNGSIVAMFEYATQQTSPDIAKPHPRMLKYCLQHFRLQKDEVILVGDNLETDILLGSRCGVETIFVQTGVHQKEDVDRLQIYPTHIVQNLMECMNFDFMK